jgi:hypothetical protein
MDEFPDHLFTRMLFTAGEVIFEEGQRGDCAYLIDRGEVAILKRRSRGYHPLVQALLRIFVNNIRSLTRDP